MSKMSTRQGDASVDHYIIHAPLPPSLKHARPSLHTRPSENYRAIVSPGEPQQQLKHAMKQPTDRTFTTATSAITLDGCLAFHFVDFLFIPGKQDYILDLGH